MPRKYGKDPVQPPLNIAYLTTTYPSVSHTFIRREIHELERRGHKILRLALRPTDAKLIDPLDQEEVDKTIHCLSLPVWQHILSLIRTILIQPLCFLKAFRATLSMGEKSDRGLFKHFGYLVEACSLLQIIKQRDIQHIHAHFGTNSAAVARLIGLCGGPSYSFTVHGPTEFDASIGFDLRGKIKDAAFVIAITDFCSAQLRRWSPPTEWAKIHIIHCTVGDDFFDATEPINSNSRTFACVGRLTPQKGQLTLIEAFAQLITAGHDAQLVFVGDGELRSSIQKKIAKYGNLFGSNLI